MKKHFKSTYSEYSWEFFQDEKIPDSDLITCVFAVVKYNWKFFLTKNHRWWELPWWHIEKWENLKECLDREMMEEIWVKVDNEKFFWYKKITNFEKTKNRDWWYYPFPNSYIVFYVCDAVCTNSKIFCPDTLDYWLFSYDEVLKKADEDNRKIFEIIVKFDKRIN